MVHVIILAGGSGTRFWPISRPDQPKQFIRLPTGRTMLENALLSIRGLAVKRKNIYLSVNKEYALKISLSLRKFSIPGKNIFREPEVRNNFAPIGVITQKIYAKDKDAVIIVLPCDNYVKYKSRFIFALEKSIAVAGKGHIAVLGFIPDAPETGYGYIKTKSARAAKRRSAGSFFKIEKFIEKPGKEKAEEFIKDKRYYWNGGIFIFKAQVMLEEIKKFMPQDYNLISKITDAQGIKRFWSYFSSLSIDYAVMEKTKKGALVPVDFGWIDLGSWKGLARLYKSDKNGNVFKGNCIDIDSKNIISWSANRLVATLGLDNIIIVDTPDALLVCAKERAQDVKKIVKLL